MIPNRCYLSLSSSQIGPQDGEVVTFSAPCICKDQVEVWLNRCLNYSKKRSGHILINHYRLMGTMRETIRAEFAKSMVTYEDMPRETWLFDYPAQVVQILKS